METILDSPSTPVTNAEYGGFWLRVVAAIIDAIVLMIPQWMISYSFMGSLTSVDPGAIFAKMIPVQIGSLVLSWLYSALMESSANQATLGKMALGLKVTDLNGEKISFARATGRHFSKYLSAFILFIGFLMVAFSSKKQGLHDQIVNTLVVRKNNY